MTTILATDLKPDSLKAGVPTLHHLSNSQSIKVLWLLEELGIEYNLVKYDRNAGRAPASMEKVHPLGKAPTLVTKDNRVIIESFVIITYLIATYSPTGPFQAPDPLKSDEISSYAASTFSPVTSVELLVELINNQTPWPISYITKAIRSKVQTNYTKGELVKAMRYLEGELGDEEWFNGKHVGKADFMCVFPLDMVAGRGWVDFEKESPKIAAWRKRLRERPAWKKALKKGGQYDMMSHGRDG